MKALIYWVKRVAEHEPLLAVARFARRCSYSGAGERSALGRSVERSRAVGYQQGSAIDASSAARVGRQLGAKYYVTGKVGAVDEKMKKVRRVQYSLFLQVIEVETSMIRFQNETARSKAIKR